MSSIEKNTEGLQISVPKTTSVAIVKSRYNPEITDPLLESCQEELKKGGVLEENITVMEVPGAYELPLGCKNLIKTKRPDAVIALGAVIKGETPHFDYICSAVSHGIMKINLNMDTPVIFGILTPNNIQQAKARIKNGAHGDKGKEAALSALMMINNLTK